jgi:ABC-type transport system substrate-binding protein
MTKISIPKDSAIRAAPLITALSPPQSPPLVMIPYFFIKKSPSNAHQQNQWILVKPSRFGNGKRLHLKGEFALSFGFKIRCTHFSNEMKNILCQKWCLLFFLALVFFSTRCTKEEKKSPTEVARQKIFKYSTEGAPTSLDPVQSATMYANEIVTAVYDQLYGYHYLVRPFKIKPNLAVKLPEVSGDKKTYTIKIKSGVFYTDDPGFPSGKGREVVAEDFVFAMKRHFDSKNTSQGQYLWQDKIEGMENWKNAGADYNAPVSGLTALDRHTIRIKLKKPFPQLIYTLATGFSSLVPREIVTHYGREFGLHAVGSGPFKLEFFNTQKAILVRNKEYRAETMDVDGFDEKEHGPFGLALLAGKKIPFVDIVEIYFMEEASSMWNSLNKGGEIDFGRVFTEQQKSVVESTEPLTLTPDFAQKFHVKKQSFFGLEYNAFNMDDPKIGYSKNPAQNEKNRVLRCAIRKSYDWEIKKREFFHGMADITPGIIPKGVDGYDPNLSRESVMADPMIAKDMIVKAGWKENELPVIEYHNVGSVRMKQYYEIFRGGLVKAGYPKKKITFVPYATFGDFNKALRERKAMVMSYGWGMDYPDAENVLGLFYGPNASPGSNAANYHNPDFDRLFEEASVMLPSPARTSIYRRLNQMVIDDCPAISAFGPQVLYLWRKNITLYYEKYVLGNIFKYVDVN